jgi:2-dehydro-3-deoxyphosphogluconate aldolase/(4S)-4-hydroxy-2-oxoglutarate aldolase
MLSENGLKLLSAFQHSGFFPIVNRYDEAHVVRIAALMRSFAINIVEITIRDAGALKCIEAVRKAYPDMLIGAGSILDEPTFQRAHRAGADFFVSPCYHQPIAEYAMRNGFTYIPAIATPSELFQALRAGFRVIKVFPASQVGAAYLDAIAKPFAGYDFYFVPTGGINSSNFVDFLRLSNVAACGISSFMEADDASAADGKKLEGRIAALCALRDNMRGIHPLPAAPV